ncbi:MAG: Ig-like domain-containing protein [Bacteroidetes bacterium]|nr:Ig-like domain-containing protein [Bacteroidota bacterium]
MKNMRTNNFTLAIFLGFMLAVLSDCQRNLSDDVEFAKYPNTPGVFIDGFVGGLQYFPFAGSKLNAFTVDTETRYAGTASMRIDVPNVGDASGAYAGAIFPDNGGRDLSDFDALTFWAKATQSGTINEIGFGNDFGENKHMVTLNNMRINTTWTKYIIPLPDPSQLSFEKGLFYYAEGPENGNGYTFWIDELKFEKLGTVAQPRPAILSGEDKTETSFIGVNTSIGGLTQTFNLASGQNLTVSVAPSYFTFTSSNVEVARVNEQGVVSVVGAGTAKITAILGGVKAKGSLTIQSLGQFTKAPTPPARNAADVISVFSNAYTNIPVDFYNGFFAPYQTTLGGADLTINGDNIIQYTQLNFVATEFKNPTVNASQMTHLHVDIQIREAIDPSDFITIQLGDFGTNGAFGGGDDKSGDYKILSAGLSSNQWISLDIPLASFTGLTNRSNLAQIFFISSDATSNNTPTISTILVDNMYFYK